MLHRIASSQGNAAGISPRFNGRVLPALLAVASAVIVMQSAGVANAASPTPQSYGLFNTGISPAGMLGMEALDPYYTVAYEPGTGSTPDPGTALTGSSMYVTNMLTPGGQPYLPWQPADNSTSSFISPFPTYSGGQSNLGGVYDVSTTFDLTGVSLSTLSLYGRFESDDRIDNIIVNGVSTGIAFPDPNYNTFTAYYNLSSYLKPGSNTILFKLYNFTTGSNTDPVALRAEFVNAVPEPSVYAGIGGLLGLGLLGRLLARRRTGATI